MEIIDIQPTLSISLLLMGFKLMAGAVASCALIGVAVGVGISYIVAYFVLFMVYSPSVP